MKTNKDEFLAQLVSSQYPVIILPDISNKEIACAALGIFNILKSMDKTVDVISYKRPDPQIAFLPGFPAIKDKVEHARNFVLSFNTEKNKIKNVHWEQEKDRLDIFITPQSGSISPKDFSFAPGQFQYDFVIVLGVPELQHVGACYEENADLFFELPIANIDYHISNEQYGQLNLVNVKSAGVSEILANLFLESSNNQIKINQKAADCFYAGVMEATESFQNTRTTPNTLTTAAKLIDAGANHKNITKHLYKSQNIQTIKLWGQLMSKLQYHKALNLAWIKVDEETLDNHQDKNHPGRQVIPTQRLRNIFDKIRNSYSKADTLMLLWETKHKITRGLIQNSNRELLKELLKGIEWGNAVIFEFNEPLEEAEPKIIKILEEGYKNEN